MGFRLSAQGGIQIGSWWGASVGSSGRWYNGTGIFARWIRSPVPGWLADPEIWRHRRRPSPVRPGGLGTTTWGVGNTSDGWRVDKEGWRWQYSYRLRWLRASSCSKKEIINVFDWKGRWFGNSCYEIDSKLGTDMVFDGRDHLHSMISVVFIQCYDLTA